MKIEVSVEEHDIIRQAILEDWRSINNDIRKIKEIRKVRNLLDHEKVDMKDWKRFRKALKVIIGYYYTSDETKEILSKKGY